MGKYSLRGGQNLDDQIEQDVARVAKVLWDLPNSHVLKGLVLMGGYGRGEGTPLIENGQTRPFNDYDFIVVSRPLTPIGKRHMRESLKGAQESLQQELGIGVDLFLHTTLSLKWAEPSLMNYEMRWGHQVVKGPESLLNVMPAWNWEDIPLVEGTRLLLNRGALLLMLQEKMEEWLMEDPTRVVNYLMKNYLALGDCVLMARGGYEISYIAKKEKAARLKAVDRLPEWPWIQLRYLEAVNFKEWADPSPFSPEELRFRYTELSQRFADFFLWFEGIRLGTTFADEEEYAQYLDQSKWDLKSILKGLWLFGGGASKANWRWLGVPPHYRLFVALPLLVREKFEHPLLEQLQVKDRFFPLWRRLG